MNLNRFLFEPVYFMTYGKTLLDKQIDVFLEWGLRANVASLSYKSWLSLFKNFTTKEDIIDVTNADVDLFVEYVHTIHNSQCLINQSRRAINAIIRFYMARSKNGLKRGKGGRPPAISQILKAKEYRKKGLTLGEIGKLLGSDKSLVHRWINRSLDGLL